MEQLSLFEKEKRNDWKWHFKDYPPKNGLKVFSTFACGGGSTMGYKLAGCEVVGCLEIDPRMNKVYIENHHPKYNYLEDIRDFNKRKDLPKELFNLDILDGSPPCSTFSMAGNREKAWGREKKFREGQKLQTLDDLLFVFLDTVAKLQPKVAIMENVEGLTLGNAWAYVQGIYKKFKDTGYSVKHWLLKCEDMGIPQTRHRIFFIATRLNFDLSKINLEFNYLPIFYKDIKTNNEKQPTLYQKKLLDNIIDGDKNMGDINYRLNRSKTGFGDKIVWGNNILPTITANGKIFCAEDKKPISDIDIILGSTFPLDYNFCNEKVRYVCGMSVPPVMIKRIVTRIIESGIFGGLYAI